MTPKSYNVDNKKEAELYCNKILEIDNNYYQAWLLKGKAAGWQSTAAVIRIDEAVNCFTKAIDLAPEEEKESLKTEISSEITSLTSALIRLCSKHFTDYPSQDNAKQVMEAALLMNKVTIHLLEKCGTKTEDVTASMATVIQNAAIDAWNNKVWPEYGGKDNHPSQFAWERYITQGDAVIKMLELAIAICNNDDKADTTRYAKLIDIETKLCDSGSYKYSSSSWNLEYQLNQQAKDIRNQHIMDWHKAWNAIDSSHVIPNEDSVKRDTNKIATEQKNSDMFVCVATLIVVVIALVWGFLS